ncbi:MAG: FAD-dependent oxidoreductase [bacterium]
MPAIREGAREVPVAADCDVCVVGGSCTGAFAALAAARMGATVALVERNGFLGGTATAGLVSVWHSLYDTAHERQIIAGLTSEVIDRLSRRGAARIGKPDGNRHVAFNSAELTIELDRMVREAGVRLFLHTLFVRPAVEDGCVVAAIVEDKSGRRAVRASVFIDATGDGDLVARSGLPVRVGGPLQPPTCCAVVRGLAEIRKRQPDFRLADAVFDPDLPGALPPGFLWSSPIVGADDLTMIAGTRVNGANCADADELTGAEIEGRRQVRQMVDLLCEQFDGGDRVSLVQLPAALGVRETRHVGARHRLTESEVLHGVRFDDAIANGSDRVDVHHSDRPGLTFRYLDGTERYARPGAETVETRWRPESDEAPTFYQIPYRSLVPQGARNVLAAGRLIDADPGAYGAIRVMVNCNQTGEAAGTAAFLALDADVPVANLDPARLRDALRAGGAVII